jgi:hypothetical protein
LIERPYSIEVCVQNILKELIFVSIVYGDAGICEGLIGEIIVKLSCGLNEDSRMIVL